MAFLRAAVCAALFLSGSVSGVRAQDVTLSSPDGAVEITGSLLGFDGEFYRVDTRFGDLTVDGSGVSCEGPGCPSLSDYVAELTLSGSAAMAEVLLPALLEGFALSNGYQARRDEGPGSEFTYVLLSGGQPAARFHFLPGTTDEGFADLLAGDADLVMALREIRPDERAQARELLVHHLDVLGVVLAGVRLGFGDPVLQSRALGADALELADQRHNASGAEAELFGQSRHPATTHGHPLEQITRDARVLHGNRALAGGPVLAVELEQPLECPQVAGDARGDLGLGVVLGG